MAVELSQIKVGAVFQFKTAPRRVVGTTENIGNGFNVRWEYADGKRRGGKAGGSQWVHYFRADAIEEIPDPATGGLRTLKISGQKVQSLAEAVPITLTTKCPQKWAFMDRETGDLWGHDGSGFRRLSAQEADEIGQIAAAAKNKPKD